MAAAAVDQATGLLQKLALDPTGKAGDVPGTKEKALANGEAAAVVNQKPVMEWPGTPQMQDYKDATMYYGAYPTYVYGGDELLISSAIEVGVRWKAYRLWKVAI